jgi:hypothetical protein
VSPNNKVVQDRRRFSRIIALMDCEFTFKELTHKAVVVDLSLNGALLSSKFLPPNGSSIKLLLKSPQSNKTFTLGGTVLRGGWGTSEHGEVSRFAVQIDSLAPDLVKVLNSLQLTK